MVARRASGALRLPLSTADAVVCGLALAIVSAGYRAALVRLRPQVSPMCFHYLQWAPTVSVLAICGSVVAIAHVGRGAGGVVVDRRRGRTHAVGRVSIFVRQAGERRRRRSAGSSLRRVRQQLTRFSDAAGRDVVEGTVVARFAAGQRTASVHLGVLPAVRARAGDCVRRGGRVGRRSEDGAEPGLRGAVRREARGPFGGSDRRAGFVFRTLQRLRRLKQERNDDGSLAATHLDDDLHVRRDVPGVPGAGVPGLGLGPRHLAVRRLTPTKESPPSRPNLRRGDDHSSFALPDAGGRTSTTAADRLPVR